MIDEQGHVSNQKIVRPFQIDDLKTLLEMNNAAVPAVSEVTQSELSELIEKSLICLVAEVSAKPVGFLLCLGPGITYQSPNYHWLSDNVSDFAYTDRICVKDNMRGLKLGDALYAALFKCFAGTDTSFVCEVNERPPNPGSLRFHKRLGFEEIGNADYGEKAVVFLQRPPEPLENYAP